MLGHQLSLAIPPWVDTMSTSDSSDINKCTVQCASPMSVILQCKLLAGTHKKRCFIRSFIHSFIHSFIRNLVSGLVLRKLRSALRRGPRVSGRKSLSVVYYVVCWDVGDAVYCGTTGTVIRQCVSQWCRQLHVYVEEHRRRRWADCSTYSQVYVLTTLALQLTVLTVALMAWPVVCTSVCLSSVALCAVAKWYFEGVGDGTVG